jgi:Co/Zn/Cd efflux system component
MGIVGGGLVAVGEKLLTETGKVLLDREMDHPVVEEVRQAIESGAGRGNVDIADLHVWRVSKQSYACAISIVTHDAGLTPGRGEAVSEHEEIVHTTIETTPARLVVASTENHRRFFVIAARHAF